MRLSHLGSRVQQQIKDRARELLEEARKTGKERFEKENERRAAKGLAPLYNAQLAMAKSWPPCILTDPYDGAPEGCERVYGTDGAFYGVPLAMDEISFIDTWQEWPAAIEIMLMMAGLGIDYDELVNTLGFSLTYGVLGLVTDGESMLVGIRSGKANRSGCLSMPGGFMWPGEGLSDAMERHTRGEVKLPWSHDSRACKAQESRLGVSWKGHDRAPSITFVVPLPVDKSMLDQPTVAASDQWASNIMLRIPFPEVEAALANNLAPISNRFIAQGLIVTDGFAGDVVVPLRQQMRAFKRRRS